MEDVVGKFDSPPEHVLTEIQRVRKLDPHTEGSASSYQGERREFRRSFRLNPEVPNDGESATPKWSVTDVCTYIVTAEGMSFVDREVYATFLYVATENGGDVCGYCGYDNGPNGESRMGFDCGMCGGN